MRSRHILASAFSNATKCGNLHFAASHHENMTYAMRSSSYFWFSRLMRCHQMPPSILLVAAMAGAEYAVLHAVLRIFFARKYQCNTLGSVGSKSYTHIVFLRRSYVCLCVCECEVSNNKFPQPYPQNPTKINVHRDLLKIFLSQQFQPAAVTAVALGARAQRPRALASCRCTCFQLPVV